MQLFHGLLRQGWCFLYSRSDVAETERGSFGEEFAPPVGNDFLDSMPEADGPQTIDQHFEAANESREVLKRKEFVRARKARQWITDDNFVTNLVQVILGTQPNESYLHLMLKEYAQGTWTGQLGLQHVPLVRLVQPAASPVSETLEHYCHMQTTPTTVLLEVVASMECFDLRQQQASMFEMLLDMASSVWRKQHRKHDAYPWKLALLLVGDYPYEMKVRLLTEFFSLRPCCLEEGYARPLQEKFVTVGIHECLQPGSAMMMCLVNTFCSKTQNVELENNFARCTSARAFVRGNRHSAATMCCKHLAADIHQSHQAALGFEKRSGRGNKRLCGDEFGCSAKRLLDAANEEAGSMLNVASTLSTATRSGSDVRASQQKPKLSQRLNGWHVCVQDVFASEPAQPSESSSARLVRLTAVAKEKMKDVQQREKYRATAKAINEANKQTIAANPQQQGLLALFDPDKTLAKIGPWGLGDESYPLASKIVEKRCQEAGFVKRYHSAFTRAYGGLVEQAEQLDSNTVVLEKFCMKLGSCFNALPPSEKANILTVLKQMKDIVRLHRGRRQTDHHPSYLLLIAQEKNGLGLRSVDFPKAYLLCQATLSPLDLCLWEGKISEVGNSGECDSLMCPKSFSVTLEHTVFSDHFQPPRQARTLPALQTMRQFAYAFRERGFEGLELRVTLRYEITSLNSLLLRDAEAIFGLVPEGNDLPINDIDDDDDGNDYGDHNHDSGGDDDDRANQENISMCMSLLKEEPHRKQPRQTQRQATDEPRLRPPKSSSSSSHKPKPRSGDL